MRLKKWALAGGILLLTAGAASAAIVTTDLNLRSGPGTRFAVIDSMPAGAHVRVLDCGGSWCRVSWRGEQGFASASYLAGGGRAYAYERPVYVAPPPVVRFGFGWGGRRHHYRHHRWHH